MTRIINEEAVFLLGGRDLEMKTIYELLQKHRPGQLVDKKLQWGAAFSAYAEEIADARSRGVDVIAVELADDMPEDWPHREAIIFVDHHGERAGRDAPTSLEQIFDLLALPQERWTRQFELVATNDRAHINGMLDIGASKEEIKKIRHHDRKIQGLTARQELEALEAIAARLIDGRLIRLRVPGNRAGAVTDLIHPVLGGPGADNLLVELDNELAFFGDGSVVQTLAREFPQSWSGGALPDRGFWGAVAEIGSGKRERMIQRLGALAVC